MKIIRQHVRHEVSDELICTNCLDKYAPAIAMLLNSISILDPALDPFHFDAVLDSYELFILPS